MHSMHPQHKFISPLLKELTNPHPWNRMLRICGFSCTKRTPGPSALLSMRKMQPHTCAQVREDVSIGIHSRQNQRHLHMILASGAQASKFGRAG